MLLCDKQPLYYEYEEKKELSLTSLTLSVVGDTEWLEVGWLKSKESSRIIIFLAQLSLKKSRDVLIFTTFKYKCQK